MLAGIVLVVVVTLVVGSLLHGVNEMGKQPKRVERAPRRVVVRGPVELL